MDSVELAKVNVVAATLAEARAIAEKLDARGLQVEAIDAEDGLMNLPEEVDLWVIILPKTSHPLRDVLKPSGAPPRLRWICLLDAADREAFAAAYHSGAGDVMLLPASAHELQFRVNQLAGSNPRRLQHLLQEQHVLQFLKDLHQRGIERLEPRLHPLLPCGHVYPQAAEALGDSVCSAPYLEQLAEQGFLARKVANRLRTCATCGSIHLNYREVCPECTSVSVAEEDMIHHFACAYVGPLETFQQGPQLICPKCHAQLRHIGLDYEKPARQSRCLDCRAIFSQPVVQAQCLTCGSLWEPGETLERLVYEYELTPLAHEVVAEGRVRGVSLEGILRSRQTGLHSRQFFRYELERELARFQRYKTPYSIIGIRLEGWREMLLQQSSRAEQYAHSIYQAISHRLRMLDTTCVWSEDVIMILLSDTPETGGHVVARRMHENVQGLEFLYSIARPRIGVSLLASEATLKTPEEVIDSLLKDLAA